MKNYLSLFKIMFQTNFAKSFKFLKNINWAKQTLVDFKIEHSFRETYSVLIRKKIVFYTCLGDI